MKIRPLLLIIPIILVLFCLFGIFSHNRDMFFYGLSSIVLCTFLPILSWLLKKETEGWKTISVQVFILFSVYLANIGNLYSFWWYDIVLHFLSGVFISLIVPTLIIPRKTAMIMTKAQWICFSIIVSMAIAGLWEIVEFLFDIFTSSDVQRNLSVEKELLGVSWQNPGLKDTMNDIINGTVGGIVGAFLNLISISKK